MGPRFAWTDQDPRGPWTRCSTRPCHPLQTHETVRRANGLRKVDWTLGKLIYYSNTTNQNQQKEGSGMAIGREPVISIEGTVSEVVYMSPETGFAVIEVETDEELLPVVGELYGVSEGEELRLTGSYSNHPKFGRQFKAMAYERRM